jgi:hypothetical protein
MILKCRLEKSCLGVGVYPELIEGLPEVKKGDRMRYIVLSNLNIKEVVLMKLKKAALGGTILFLVLWLMVFESHGSEAGQAILANPSNGQEFQVKKMQDEFKRIVGNQTALEPEYFKAVTVDIANLILDVPEPIESQYFVYVDRNPLRQVILTCFLNSQRSVTLIGVDKVSTGNEKRAGFFITPCGVFANTIEFLGYRALGTKNDQGWCGLGVKNSRVWDFGWQKTYKKNEEISIRLLMHATDPYFGEKRLGRVDSKGCIRISGKLNKYLDHYGLLDREYEANKNKKTVAWLLKADREPSVYAGKYLLIGDSGNYNEIQK